MHATTDNDPLHRGWLAAAFLLLLAALLLPSIAVAAEGVGRVLSVRGDVTAVRDGEPRRALFRGDDIFEGDEITTGPNGRTQVRFIDEGLTNLSPATTFAVDEYRLDEDDEDGGGSIVMSFLRGAMRTVTGLIGDRDEDTYRMNTPTATIGVRGTGYALQYCDAACASEFGGQPGLYGRVDEGSIQVNTPGGSAEFGSGDYFFVAEGGVPEPILQPPSGILDGEEDEGNGDGGDGGEVEIIPLDENEDDDTFLSDDGSDETDFEAGDEFEQGVTGLVGAGVVAEWGGFQSTGIKLFGDDSEFTTNNDSNLDSATFDDGTTIAVLDASLDESGSLEELGVGWGRWNGTFSISGRTVSGNMAFSVTDNLTEPGTLGGLTGSFDYNLAGAPSAFDINGDLWSVDELSLNVAFGASTDPITLNSFVLLSQTGSFVGDVRLDSLNSGSSTLDLDNNTLVLQLGGGNLFGNSRIEGKFIGVNAEGMVTVFELDFSDTILFGTSVLSK